MKYKGCVDYEKIRKQDFGVIINNILDKDLLQSVLRIEPCGMKLSDWRNIAYHHTYALRDDGNIDCTYLFLISLMIFLKTSHFKKLLLDKQSKGNNLELVYCHKSFN